MWLVLKSLFIPPVCGSGSKIAVKVRIRDVWTWNSVHYFFLKVLPIFTECRRTGMYGHGLCAYFFIKISRNDNNHVPVPVMLFLGGYFDKLWVL